jgi:hypothetical protein
MAGPALAAWVSNVADPLLSLDAREVLEALAAIPACLPSLQVGPAAGRGSLPPCCFLAPVCACVFF